MLRTRLLTAAVLLPAVGALVVFAPDWFFTTFIAAVAIWGLYEVAAISGASPMVAIPLLALVAGLPLFGLLYGGEMGWLVPLLVILMMLALVARVEAGGATGAFRGPRLVLIGAAYVGVLFPYFALLRNAPGGVSMLLLVILLVVASDSAAYFVGMYLGRTKLAPNVSPNKTVEGAAGGLIATMAVGLLLFQMRGGTWDAGPVLLFSAMISFLAQLGDLAGSALKRSAGVKDSGWIFPGHGGLLDRACSLVFAVVFAYYWSR